MSDTPSIADLVARWQQLSQQGQPPALEVLCAGQPERLEALKQHIRAVASLERFLGLTGAATGDDLHLGRATEPGLAKAVGGLLQVGGAYAQAGLASGGEDEFLGQRLQQQRPCPFRHNRKSCSDSAASPAAATTPGFGSGMTVPFRSASRASGLRRSAPGRRMGQGRCRCARASPPLALGRRTGTQRYWSA